MKYKKVIASLLTGSVLLSACIGTTYAEGITFDSVGTEETASETPVEPEATDPEIADPGDTEVAVTETPTEGTEGTETPVAPETPEVEEPEFVPEEDVPSEVPENPVEGNQPSEEFVEEVTPTDMPTPTPVDEKKNLVIDFANCKYGSIVTVNGDTGVIATINVDGENNEVQYKGESYNIEGNVVLEDIQDTNISVETEWEDLGSDVVSVNAMDAEGNVLFSKDDYTYPSSETTVDFVMGEKGNTDLYIEFKNMSPFTDFVLDCPYDENDPIFQVPLKDMIGGDAGLDQLIEETEPMGEGTELLDKDGFTTLHNPEVKFRAIADSGSCTVTMGRVLSYESGLYNTHEYTVHIGTASAYGYCMQAHLNSPSNTKCRYALVDGTGLKVPPSSNAVTNVNVMKLLMLSKPGWALDHFSELAFASGTSDDKVVCFIHAALSYIYCGDMPGLLPGELEGVKRAIETARKFVTGYFSDKYPGSNNDEFTQLIMETIDSYRLYVAKPENSGLQDIGFLVRGNNYGMISLKKRSKDPDMTNGNSNYSLKGAVYGVYSDKTCKKEVGTITTDENGNGSIKKLKLGEHYWVKEKKASPGYKLDPNVYEKIPRAY